MKRYFFDINTQTGLQYDFRGSVFADAYHAKEHAELIALDIGCAVEAEVSGIEVEVRDDSGHRLFAVSVQQQ